ncbi:MAG: hypothetical protein J0L83_08400 [Chitinophagales bacterium]|nr:hypothetical protein [Chitinophagales bacterium]
MKGFIVKKKQNYYRLMYWALYIALIIAFFSCKKNTQTRPLDASFIVSEVIEYAPYAAKFEEYDTDSITSCIVRFKAKEIENSNIKYEWAIGSDPNVFTTQSFLINFCNSPARVIEVALKVKKTSSIDGTIIEEAICRRKIFLKKTTTIYGEYIGNFNNEINKSTLSIQPNINLSRQSVMGIQNYTGILIVSDNRNYDTLYLPNHWGASIATLSRSLYLYHFEPIPNNPINKQILPIKLTALVDKTNKEIKLSVEGFESNSYTKKFYSFTGTRQ